MPLTQATGCGKTHTISGSSEDPGLIFLTMRGLYERIEEERDQFETHVRLSYLEIYNETIRDLLSPTPTPPGPGLALREDAASKISVVGITEHIPESPEQVLEMITEGNKRRTQSPTEANAVSSRSHAVLQLNVTRKPRTAGTVEEMTSASLNIIDLAGSERASATNNHGMRMKEGANINRSLLALGSCINALCQTGGARNAKGRHIPYRNSKLTRLLKFSLGGNCKTVMIVCVSPSSAHYEETHNTLKYANQAKNIQTKVTRNLLHIDRHVAQYVQAIASLRQEVQELKEKLASSSSGDNPAERRKRESLLADATQQLQDAAAVQRDALRQAATDAAPLHAAEAVRSALSAAVAASAAPDRAILESLLAQTPDVVAPPEDTYRLAPIPLPPAVTADATSTALYAARHAHLEANLAAEARTAALQAARQLLQDTIGRRLIDLALGTAHTTQTLRAAAERLDDDLGDEDRAALATELRTAGERGAAALQQAMGAHVPDKAPEARKAAHPSPARCVRPSIGSRPSIGTRPAGEAARFMRLASPRRRALRPSVGARHRNIGSAPPAAPAAPDAPKDAKPSAAPPVPAAAPKARVSLAPGVRKSLAPRPSVVPAPRRSVAPTDAPVRALEPRKAAADVRRTLPDGPRKMAAAPTESVRKPALPDKVSEPSALDSRAPERRPAERRPEKRSAEAAPSDVRAPPAAPTAASTTAPRARAEGDTRPARLTLSDTSDDAVQPVNTSPATTAEPILSPTLAMRTTSPARGSSPARGPSTSPSAPRGEAGVKRRGLFQRQFLTRPETDDGDSTMDSLLHTDLGDLSAQLPREDWQASLLDTPRRTSSSFTTPSPRGHRSRESREMPA